MREKKLPAAIGEQILDVILKPHKHKHRKGRSKQHNKPEIEKSRPAHIDTEHTDQKSTKSGDDNSGHVDNTMYKKRGVLKEEWLLILVQGRMWPIKHEWGKLLMQRFDRSPAASLQKIVIMSSFVMSRY